MEYISTRGAAPSLDFEAVLLAGLAADGGLYVPRQLPRFSHARIAAMASLNYSQLALEVVRPFVGGCIPDGDLEVLIDSCYREFRHPQTAPLVPLQADEWVLELFHGPTLAFKDFALQLLGRMLDYLMQRRRRRVVVLGATSGDTGSAAIEGCRRCANIDIFILHPHRRISDVQRRQMTTVRADNIHNIAVQGDFDDCQAMVKASFAERGFLPADRELVAVNSINWARIMAQIVYYFYAAVRVGAPRREVTFSVPTGNFGDIFAGYLAGQMGLPVRQLIIATNSNDVLHRTLTHGEYRRGELHHTLSPSMDISVSSNFERLLFDLYQRDGSAIAALMRQFDTGAITLERAAGERMRALFSSRAVSDLETCDTIAEVYADSKYLLDPHSAIALKAAREVGSDGAMISLATAHPAKFPEAVARAGLTVEPALPPHLADLFERSEHYQVLPSDLAAVQACIAGHLHS